MEPGVQSEISEEEQVDTDWARLEVESSTSDSGDDQVQPEQTNIMQYVMQWYVHWVLALLAH